MNLIDRAVPASRKYAENNVNVIINEEIIDNKNTPYDFIDIVCHKNRNEKAAANGIYEILS